VVLLVVVVGAVVLGGGEADEAGGEGVVADHLVAVGAFDVQLEEDAVGVPQRGVLRVDGVDQLVGALVEQLVGGFGVVGEQQQLGLRVGGGREYERVCGDGGGPLSGRCGRRRRASRAVCGGCSRKVV
jgi:hypothetical protein